MAEPRTAESLGRRKRRIPPDRLCTVIWMRGREPQLELTMGAALVVLMPLQRGLDQFNEAVSRSNFKYS